MSPRTGSNKVCQKCGAEFYAARCEAKRKYCSAECGYSAVRRHGMSYTPVHNAWCDMRKRCTQLGADAVFDKSNEIDALVEYCIEQCEALRME